MVIPHLSAPGFALPLDDDFSEKVLPFTFIQARDLPRAQ